MGVWALDSYVKLVKLVVNIITFHSVQYLQLKEQNVIPFFFNSAILLQLSLYNKTKPESIRLLCKLIDVINRKTISP